MKIARTEGRMRGKQPGLQPAADVYLVERGRTGNHAIGQAELISIARPTFYRATQRPGEPMLARARRP